MKEVYVIEEQWSSGGKKVRYVKSISFTDCGVKIEYTDHLSFAARVTRLGAAEGFAICVPSGKVKKAVDIPKPTMEEALKENQNGG